MSLESAQLNYLENSYAIFKDCLAQGRLADCKIIIGNLVEQGYEKEAKEMSQELNEDIALHES